MHMTLIAAAWFSLNGSSAEARRIEPQDSRAIPPPVEPTYDPLPGPYLGSVDEQGALKDVGVAQNAIQSWHGPNLSAFILCFRPAKQPVNWNLAFAALRNVSHELQSLGAAVVVIAAERICPTPSNVSMMGKSHVEIKGVIRFRG
ncbi:hypothetical protein [Sphingomonas sp. NPDC079357]|uniref:hypothetical protein n=1 Tax=Sphingomonas sp. NPDC079357 TaxID=3364518 RepID=UPI00384B48F6